MKKKVLLSAAVAVMLVAALAVTAFAATSVDGPGSIENGERITITISTTADGFSGNISTSGLSFVSCDNDLCNSSSAIILADAGQSSATYTYTVTAGPGETASFRVSNGTESDGDSDSSVSVGGWSATVPAAPTNPPTQTPAPPTATPSATATATATTTPSSSARPTTPTLPPSSAVPSGSLMPSAVPSGQPGTSGAPGITTQKPSSSTTNKKDNMPKTGDSTMDLWTLVVIAAACGAVAIVAGKKVFSHR